MAVTKKEYIFVSFLITCVSVGLLTAAFATQNWVEGEWFTNNARSNLINFGLFGGTFVNRILSTPFPNYIYMTCVLGENACAFSCKTTSESRKKEIELILSGSLPSSLSCDSSPSTPNQEINPENLLWLNGGMYISTLVFLALSLLFAVLSACGAFYNARKSPIEPLAGILGLLIWNTCSTVASFLVLLLWGVFYTQSTVYNLSFVHIIVEKSESVTSFFGFSYWFVLGSAVCHILSVAILIWRDWLISKEPPPPTINIDKNTDDTIFLY